MAYSYPLQLLIHNNFNFKSVPKPLLGEPKQLLATKKYKINNDTLELIPGESRIYNCILSAQ